MSAKDLILPYLNRFVAINQEKSSAKLELTCSNRKITVNLLHNLRVIEEVTPYLKYESPAYSEILKKNVNNSQSIRLQKRTQLSAEESRAEIKRQQYIARKAKMMQKKPPVRLQKPPVMLKKSNFQLKKQGKHIQKLSKTLKKW